MNFGSAPAVAARTMRNPICSATACARCGTTASGVLTVTDGTRTATITLVGDYTHSTFIASSDNSGGVIVVDPAPPPHRFIAAAASLAASAGAPAVEARQALCVHPPLMLARPGAMIA